MRAILLLAGIGKRLRPWTENHPKCLFPVGGAPLLERFLVQLPALGIDDFVIVWGHEGGQIKGYVEQHFPRLPVTFIENPDYTIGNVVSLWLAQRYMRGETIVMDGDVLFAPEILERLVQSANPRCVLLDETSKDTGEEMKLMARGDRVWSIGRKVDGAYDVVGEGVGFLKLDDEGNRAMVAGLRKFVAEGRTRSEYEEVMNEVMKELPIGFERVGGIPWTEIDFPEDAEKAENVILPAIRARGGR
jgi:choline kinase